MQRPSILKSSGFSVEEPEGRQPPKVRIFPCIIKLVLSFVLVMSLIVGYALSFKVVTVGPLSIGLYGIILLVDFLVQFSCAMLNRRDVNRIAAQAKGATDDIANEKASTPSEPQADISIAVVGYREDEDAWRKCLRSLQNQTLRPRSLVAVVDGNDAPDLVMSDAFDAEFQGQNARVINLPVLLSEIYQKTYHKTLAACGEDAPGLMGTLARWFNNRQTPGEAEAHRVARERIMHEVATWESYYSISSYSAVCFTQPHGHKRVSLSWVC